MVGHRQLRLLLTEQLWSVKLRFPSCSLSPGQMLPSLRQHMEPVTCPSLLSAAWCFSTELLAVTRHGGRARRSLCQLTAPEPGWSNTGGPLTRLHPRRESLLWVQPRTGNRAREGTCMRGSCAKARAHKWNLGRCLWQSQPLRLYLPAPALCVERQRLLPS